MSSTGSSAATEPAGGPPSRLQASSHRYGEKAIQGLLALCGILSVLTTTAIVISLIGPTIGFFEVVPIGDFLFGTDWTPQFEPPSFGVLAIVAGTLNVTLWAMLFAIPIGLGVGDLPQRVRAPARAQDGQAGARDPRRHPDRGDRLLRGQLHPARDHPAALAGRLPRRRRRQAVHGPRGRPRHRPDDRADHRLDLRGRDVGRAARPARRRLRDSARPRRKVATRVVFPAALSGIVASIVLAISRAARRDDDRRPRRRLDPATSPSTRSKRSRR